MWRGTSAPASPHQFIRPAYCRLNLPSKSSPRAESCVHLVPGMDHPSDSLRVLTRVNKVVETRDVTWEATLDVEAPSPQLPEIPKQGGTLGLGDAPELGGTENFASEPMTPLSRLRREILHQLRVMSPMTQASEHFRAEEWSQTTLQRPAADRPTTILPLRLAVTCQPRRTESWATRQPLTVKL